MARAAWPRADAYLEGFPAAPVAHMPAWREAVNAAYGHRCYCLAAERSGRVRGVLPLFFLQSRFFGRTLASAPFASEGGICADSPEDARELVEEARALARSLDARVEIKSLAPTPGLDLPRLEDYATYELEIGEEAADWARVRPGVRKDVRKARRQGVAVEEGRDLFADFYDVFAVAQRAHGTPVHARAFLRAVLDGFGSQACLLVARHRGRALAAMLCVHHRDRFLPLFGGSRPEARPLRANPLLFWEALRRARTSGARRVDFGRSLRGSGHAWFKASWGAIERPLCYEYVLPEPGPVPRVHVGNPRYDLPRRLWRLLPLPLTRALGPPLIRYVP